jgi:SnoaL-like domain
MSIDARDHLAILALYAEYNRTIDAGDVLGWLATFVNEGVFHHPARSYTGQVELRTFITNRSAQLSTNAVAQLMHWNDPIVLTRDAGGVTGSCQLVATGVARETGQPEVVARGRYQDSLVCTSGAWHFRERRLHIV